MLARTNGKNSFEKVPTERRADTIRPYGWKGCSHSVEYIRSGVPRQPSPAGKVDRGEVQRRFDERRMRRATFCEHTIMGLIEGISYFPKTPTGNKALQIPCGLSSSVRQSRLSRLSVCHLPRRGRLTEPADRDKDNKKHKIFVISPVRKHPHPL